jgi:hypothetical protein
METRQPGRSGYASQASQQEPVRHLVDVTDEFMKGSGPSRISPGKPTPPNKGPARQDKYPSEKRPYEKPVQKGSVNHNDTKEKPAFGASVSDNRFRDSDRIKPSGSGIKRSENQKPKKIKEKPPKNPHPYQGSKKSGKPAQSKEEPKKPAGDTDDSDKRNYLRYWATISKNKQE